METNFNKLLTEQKTVWARDVWKEARQQMMLERFLGGSSALAHRVTELTTDEKGTRAVMTLVPDLIGDGVIGDNQLEGNEEEIKAHDRVINLDMIRNANRNKGKLADQKTVVKFRENSRDVLTHWLADRSDQLFFLTLAGVAYTMKPNGVLRTGSQFPSLEFAADVSTPTTNRRLRLNDNSGAPLLLTNGLTANVTAADALSWKALISLKAYAVTQRIKPIRGMLGPGTSTYTVFVHPHSMADLKKDSDFMSVYKEALPRAPKHPLLAGGNAWWIDGLMIVEHEYVYHSDTWGGGAVKGASTILCGSQSIGYADLGPPEWTEKGFDYDNQQGISIEKICGFHTPVWPSSITGQDETFNRIVMYNARNSGTTTVDS